MKKLPSDFIDSELSRKERDKALSGAIDNGRPWTDLAHDLIRSLPPGHYTGEEIRMILTPRIGQPHHHNVWGAVIGRAVKAGLLTATGETARMIRISSHARRNPVYLKETAK